MSASNGHPPETATPPQAAEHPADAGLCAAQKLADALAYDMDSLAFDLDLILPGAIPAIMTKLKGIRKTLTSIQRLMDEAAKPLQPAVGWPGSRTARKKRRANDKAK